MTASRASGTEVVVVGGGIIGLAIAWRAARAGLAVTVVDPEPRHGASWVAAGMLAPVTELHYGEEALLALNLASAARWPGFAAELEAAAGQPAGLSTGGTLVVAVDGDDRQALNRLGDYQDSLGLGVHRLRSREARALEPMLAPSIRGGLMAEQDHRADPRMVTAALVVAGERAGVTWRPDRVTTVTCHRDRVTGVALSDGTRLAADRVVVAAGAASGSLAIDGGDGRMAGPPVRPVKGQILTLRGPAGDPLLTRAVRGLVEGSSVYLVPRDDGRLIVGATVEERGGDTTVTAGGVYELLRDATLVVPGVSELELVEAHAGSRPGTPDNAPVLGPAPDGPEGLVWATGHYRNGILLTPITAEAIGALLIDGALPAVAAPFGPERFSTTGRAEPAAEAVP